MLTLWRRHTPKCADRDKGRDYVRCKGRCPLYCDGELNGTRVRLSMRCRDLTLAMRRLDKLEAKRQENPFKPVTDAVAGFIEAHPELAPGTLRNYRRTLRFFLETCESESVKFIEEVSVDTIDTHRARRKLDTLTWVKELQTLRGFFRWCQVRGWCETNPAGMVAMPRNVKPAPVAPYTSEDVIRILAACDSFGQHAYERLRAKAMVLLLRYTGLRISDVALLERSRVRDGRICLHTGKTGQGVYLPVPQVLADALERVPGAGEQYFFWTGNGTSRAMVRSATRTLAAVFRESGVPGAKAHRFRHTLATEMLECGGTLEDVAAVLANSPAVIRKHYAQWSIKRQERISGLLQTVFSGTNLAQSVKASVCY